MVLDHLVIQNMDTTGKTVIAGKNAKKSEESFDKDELQTIIKFGAADLFKTEENEDEEKEKEVDLDAILEKAEVQEDEEAPQSEANKELLGAFKCTNIALEEEEEEEREREREKEKERAKKKAKQEELGWDAIIPEKHRASAPKPVRTIEGLEIYSDNEENLYVPIAARRKKRATKKKARQDGSEDGEEGRSMYKD